MMTYTLGNKTFRNILFSVIVVLGVVISIIVFALSYYSDKKVTQVEFNEAAENRFSALKRELDTDLAVLASLQALYYTAGKDIERSEFRNFSNHILKQHASIQALEWIPGVPDSRREAYERAARKEGFPNFQLTERIAQGKMKRAEKRKEYFPVYFVEPYKGNEIALGFDLASNPERLEALEVAAKTGEIIATARITLVQETKSQFGFIVFAPIYRKGVLINSDRPRWANLEGFALGVFRIGDIAEKATNYLKPEGVDFFIYDASAPEKEQFLYTHSSRNRKTPLLNHDHPETDFISSKTLQVAGRKWKVVYSATPDFITARRSWRPWGVLLAGLAFTGLVAGSLLININHAEQVEKSSKDLFDANTKLTHEFLERKSAEQEAENMRQAIAHMSRVSTLGELATSLAHELNQPLTAIMTNSNAALRMMSGKFDTEEIREILEDIVADDARAAKIIRRMREPLKKGKLVLRSVAVNDLVRDIHRLVRNDALLAHVSIELKLADSLPSIRGDRIQLQQVLLNVLMNALDAVKASVSGIRRIEISTVSGRDDSVAVEVSDSGPGVPETSLSRIFEPFYTTKTEGLGLGLSICKTIIEEHRGSIMAGNRPEGGARFVLVLPSENP